MVGLTLWRIFQPAGIATANGSLLTVVAKSCLVKTASTKLVILLWWFGIIVTSVLLTAFSWRISKPLLRAIKSSLMNKSKQPGWIILSRAVCYLKICQIARIPISRNRVVPAFSLVLTLGTDRKIIFRFCFLSFLLHWSVYPWSASGSCDPSYGT